ncbi:MAG: D-alanine--D-alanine ligase [Myxococcaceae bacterium]|nr:D-alanine--D-alanine ligase [Myxococcaceae bacterium]
MMERAKRIGVLMGGWGEEREASMRTGEALAQALEAKGHPVVRLFAGNALDTSLREAAVDVAVLALHGRMGEDGRVQGLLEVMGIPYTGSGVLASALAMNKGFAKKLFRQHNLATPTGYVVSAARLGDAPALHADLGFPCVVKPANGGSSVGLTLVHTREQLEPALQLACRYGGEALVERFVKGKEVTVAILDGRVLGACEVSHDGSVYDASSKSEGTARAHVPPRLPQTRLANLEQMALTAARALGCRGAVRVDFIVPEVGNEVVLEVNTLPGFTRTSLFARIAKAAGVPFEDLVEQLVAGARVDGAHVHEAPEVTAPVEVQAHAG